MFFNDFEFDNVSLSSFGFIVCTFGDTGLDVIPNGAELKLTTFSSNFGRQKHKLATSYNDCITTKFCVCKNPEIYGYNNLEITVDELREFNRWLNRSDYYTFRIIDNYEYIDFFFEATFNISKIMIDGKLIGLELNMETNKPYANGQKESVSLNGTVDNWTSSINCNSDEDGHIYAKMEITVNKAGTLDILNESEQRHTIIKNCVVGEKITLEYPVVPTTSIASHNRIANDFNWNFFRLITANGGQNNISVSLPCDIKIEYSPIVKVGI